MIFWRFHPVTRTRRLKWPKPTRWSSTVTLKNQVHSRKLTNMDPVVLASWKTGESRPLDVGFPSMIVLIGLDDEKRARTFDYRIGCQGIGYKKLFLFAAGLWVWVFFTRQTSSSFFEYIYIYYLLGTQDSLSRPKKWNPSETHVVLRLSYSNKWPSGSRSNDSN